jgi:F-type H+-transporting ATPase subunit b
MIGHVSPRSRVAALMVATAFTALANPQAAQAAVEAPTSWLGLPTWVWAWANLFVLWGLLYKFLGPMVRKGLAERKQAISEGIARAAQQHREAEQMSERLESQVAELKAQMDELVARSGEEAELDRQRILEQANAEGQRAAEQARAEIRNRTAQARTELRTYAAQLAADLAAERIAERLTAEDRRRIFDENLHRLGEQIS